MPARPSESQPPHVAKLPAASDPCSPAVPFPPRLQIEGLLSLQLHLSTLSSASHQGLCTWLLWQLSTALMLHCVLALGMDLFSSWTWTLPSPILCIRFPHRLEHGAGAQMRSRTMC